VLICLLLPLLRYPNLVLMPLVFSLFETLVKLVIGWVTQWLFLFNELEVVVRLILVNVQIEILLEHEV